MKIENQQSLGKKKYLRRINNLQIFSNYENVYGKNWVDKHLP